jgi:hypothetical protein
MDQIGTPEAQQEFDLLGRLADHAARLPAPTEGLYRREQLPRGRRAKPLNLAHSNLRDHRCTFHNQPFSSAL